MLCLSALGVYDLRRGGGQERIVSLWNLFKQKLERGKIMPIKTADSGPVLLEITLTQGGHTYVSTNDTEIYMLNSVGYMSGVLEVVDVDGYESFSNISLGWRPIVLDENGDPEDPGTGGYLPVYVDLNAASAPKDVSLPDYAMLQSISPSMLDTGNIYYIYFVNPQTPSATPLFRDTVSDVDGISLKMDAYGPTSIPEPPGYVKIKFRLRVFYTRFPNT